MFKSFSKTYNYILVLIITEFNCMINQFDPAGLAMARYDKLCFRVLFSGLFKRSRIAHQISFFGVPEIACVLRLNQATSKEYFLFRDPSHDIVDSMAST